MTKVCKIRHYNTKNKIEKNNNVLEKIRVEMEQTAKDAEKFDYKRARGLWIELEIIDKHKVEGSEEE